MTDIIDTPSPTRSRPPPLKGILKQSPQSRSSVAPGADTITTTSNTFTEKQHNGTPYRRYIYGGYKGINDLYARMIRGPDRPQMDPGTQSEKALADYERARAGRSRVRVSFDDCAFGSTHPADDARKMLCCGSVYCHKCVDGLVLANEQKCPGCGEEMVFNEAREGVLRREEDGMRMEGGYPVLPK